MQFLSQQNRIRFQTCSKPLRYRGDKSHLVYTCDFEAATLARQKLHQVAVTKIACVNGPLRAQGKKSGKTDLFCPVDLKTRHKTRRSKILSRLWLYCYKGVDSKIKSINEECFMLMLLMFYQRFDGLLGSWIINEVLKCLQYCPLCVIDIWDEPCW